MRKPMLVGMVLALWASGGRLAAGLPQEPGAKPALPLGDAERERFLLEAAIVGVRNAPGGITLSSRATLRQGAFEHDAHIQAIDEYKPSVQLSTGLEIDYRDSYRNNVAAYRLDRLLALNMVPVTVVRDYDAKKAAFTWWVDDVAMTEKDHLAKKLSAPDVADWNRHMYVVRVFDQLIYNVDRNLGNLLIDKAWRIWMIDHTRAFKIFSDLKSKKELGEHCESHLLAALRKLDEPTLKTTMKDLLNPGQIKGLLDRRDRIVAHFSTMIQERGEAGVLYELSFPGPESR